MKLYLSKKERLALSKSHTIEIEREEYLSAPSSSILHGVGENSIFDKIAYRWVYGNTDDYINIMRTQGGRATDYKNNDTSTTTGCKWYYFNKSSNQYGPLNTCIQNGRIRTITFVMKSFVISELRKSRGPYFAIIYKIQIELINQ